MTQEKTFQVALIGAGMVARTHVAALAESKVVTLRGIASRRVAVVWARLDSTPFAPACRRPPISKPI